MLETGERRPAGTPATSGESVSVLSVELTSAGCLSLRRRLTGKGSQLTATAQQIENYLDQRSQEAGVRRGIIIINNHVISVPETSQPLQASML